MSFLQKKILTQRNRRLLWLTLLVLLLIYVFFGRNYRLIYNSGESMLPSHRDGEILIIKKRDKEYKPERFKVVMIQDSSEREQIIKRIVGLPNESLRMIEGKIYINNKALLDPYYTKAEQSNENVYKIPKDCVWVIGDDREDSIYGVFLLREIRGTVVW